MLEKCISGIRISKIVLGEDPAWASQFRCSQGRAPHDMVCPRKKAENPSYAPVNNNNNKIIKPCSRLSTVRG